MVAKKYLHNDCSHDGVPSWDTIFPAKSSYRNSVAYYNLSAFGLFACFANQCFNLSNVLAVCYSL